MPLASLGLQWPRQGTMHCLSLHNHLSQFLRESLSVALMPSIITWYVCVYVNLALAENLEFEQIREYKKFVLKSFFLSW